MSEKELDNATFFSNQKKMSDRFLSVIAARMGTPRMDSQFYGETEAQDILGNIERENVAAHNENRFHGIFSPDWSRSEG